MSSTLPKVSLSEIFLTFAAIGLTGFGGGMANSGDRFFDIQMGEGQSDVCYYRGGTGGSVDQLKDSPESW